MATTRIIKNVNGESAITLGKGFIISAPLSSDRKDACRRCGKEIDNLAEYCEGDLVHILPQELNTEE